MPDTPRLDAEQLAAYFALTEVGNLLQHAVNHQLHEAGGLSSIQFQILATLSEAPGGQLRMTDIADHLVHSRSGLTYQVTQLTKAGLLTKAPSPDDERSVVVATTPEGRALLDRVMAGHVELVHRQLMAPLSRADLTALSDILGRVRTHMRTDPPRSAAPRRKGGGGA